MAAKQRFVSLAILVDLGRGTELLRRWVMAVAVCLGAMSSLLEAAPGPSPEQARLLADFNEAHAAARSGDLQLPARQGPFDVARGMMREAPEVLDLSREPAAVLERDGVERGEDQSFARQSVVGRRLLERGVRVVGAVHTGSHENWDSQPDFDGYCPKALRIDRALTSLVLDLRERDHHATVFTGLLAGAGVRGGMGCGEIDAYGAAIVRDPVHVHDPHATILHRTGLEHMRRVYRHAGRDIRLTDVAGEVVRGILA